MTVNSATIEISASAEYFYFLQTIQLSRHNFDREADRKIRLDWTVRRKLYQIFELAIPQSLKIKVPVPVMEGALRQDGPMIWRKWLIAGGCGLPKNAMVGAPWPRRIFIHPLMAIGWHQKDQWHHSVKIHLTYIIKTIVTLFCVTRTSTHSSFKITWDNSPRSKLSFWNLSLFYFEFRLWGEKDLTCRKWEDLTIS